MRNVSLDGPHCPSEIAADVEYLRNALLRDVHVLDPDRGYVCAPTYNVSMDPKILGAAARCIEHVFGKSDATIIHGIPNSGHFLATAVALAWKNPVRLHNSRKDHQLPTAWKEVLHTQVRSFTARSQGFDVYSDLTFASVRKGDRVLIVDDVCGKGETGYMVCSQMRERGVEVVGFATLLDKVYQGGLARIQSLGIPVYSCVRIEKLDMHDRVVLSEK